MGLWASGPLNTEHCDMCRSRILSALSSSSLAAAASIAELMAAILDEDVNDACMDPCICMHAHKHVMSFFSLLAFSRYHTIFTSVDYCRCISASQITVTMTN